MKKRKIYFGLALILSITALQSQSMQWVFQSSGATNGSCTSSSDCDNDILCFGLEYTPSLTGNMTSYTTSFFANCVTSGNPVLSTASCVMPDNSSMTIDDCGGSSSVLFFSSGNSGNVPISAGTPIILHQVCLNLAENETTNLVEETSLDLTISVDLSGGGVDTDFPNYTTFQANHNLVCNALAVQFQSFNAKKEGEWSSLHWTTSSEINNDYFSVQWSKDGQFFEEIEKVNGAGTTSQYTSYQLNHKNPIQGINYYRLKAVEFDGSFEYSEIRSVHFSSDDFLSFDFYPNPVKGPLRINFHSDQSNVHPIHIEVRTITGQLVFKMDHNSSESAFEIPTSNLLPATYALILKSKGKSKIERFIKM